MALPEHFVFGLTGGIGCGKSAAADYFAEHGVRIIDTDAISHRLSQPPSPALPLIDAHFGPEYLTESGALDRIKMRNRVFVDPQALTVLESIFHPLICEACQQQIAAATEAPYTLLVVPLLFEKPVFQKLIQRSIAIDCFEEQQINRVKARSGLDETQIAAIMKNQISRIERKRQADFIVSNTGTLAQLKEQILQLHQTLLILAGSR